MASERAPAPRPPAVDRRGHRRAPLDRPVIVDSEVATRTARARDVSGSGIALVGVELPLGSVVDLYFELPIGFAVETKARVMRSAGGTTGLQFVDLRHESLVALRSFCRISGLHRPAAV